MKRLQISTYIIVLLTLSNLLEPLTANAQEKKVLTKEEWAQTPLYQGVMVGADVSGLATKAFGSDMFSTEASVQLNLKNRFFPIVELGYGSIETTHEETDIFYKTSAPYFRIGMDYNVFYQKPYLPGYFTVGLRYGHSSFKYDIQAPDLTDPNWGHTEVPFAYEGVKSNAGWLELVLGLKTQVYKSFYMGFSVRYRSRLSIAKNEHSEPYYVPGFGKNGSSNIGITYNIYYKLPF
jgi:hypothetical protein